MASAQSQSAPAAAPNDRQESLGRHSKRSLTRRRREGSTGSRRRGRQGGSVSEKSSRPAAASHSNVPGESKTKKKGGFLAFLCCGSSEKTPDSGAQDSAQPAKPVTKAQATRVPQPAQGRTQQGVATADTGADESKEVIDEKAASQAPYANGTKSEPRPLAANPVLGEKVADDGTVDKQIVDAPHDQYITTQAPAQHSGTSRAPDALPTGPSPIVAAGSSTLAPVPDVAIQAPTPTIPQQDDDDAIFDRTAEQQQRDEDIEMKDASVLTEKEAKKELDEIEKEHQEESQSSPPVAGQTYIPPPPPAADGSSASQQTSMVSTPEGTSKWLLPPMRPEHTGRKCLVLDLDETLVHSSFKVSVHWALLRAIS